MIRINKLLATILVAMFFVALCGTRTARAQATATGNSDLIGQLTSQLNITPQQATGGAGAIFGLAKSRLNPEQFSKIAAAVPGMNKLLKAAPAPSAAPSPTAGGTTVGSLSSLGSAVPGNAAGNAGGLASLATSFQSLGLSPGMAGKFVPIMQNFVGAKGGSGTAEMFAGALK